MDPHNRDLETEEILEDIIHNAPDVEPAESPSSYLNPSGDGMEVERREDEADGSDDGESDSSDEGEVDGQLTKSGEASTSSKATKRGPTKKLDSRTHYTFDVILPTGEPKLPKKAADVFAKQCGVLVRDHVPISVREWKKSKGAADSEYVAERYKEGLWNDIMTHFSLPECEDPSDAAKLRALVKKWTLKKMGELFRVWKKKLWNNYLKTKKVPAFEGHLAKQANHWKAFKEYKESENAKDLSEKNKKNAAEKIYHHKLGRGATRLPCQSGIKWSNGCLTKGSNLNPSVMSGN